MFQAYSSRVLACPRKPAPAAVSDIIYIQWLGCRLYRSIGDYANRLTVLPLAVSRSMAETTDIVRCAISTILKTNTATEALITLCDTADRIDHYAGTRHKYYYDGVCEYSELVSIAVALIHLRPIIKIIRSRTGKYTVSLQLYAKTQVWLPNFRADTRFMPKP